MRGKVHTSPASPHPPGSPPPMRGKGCRRLPCRRGARITPAHAGKRYYKAGAEVATEDHPRPCGEKASLICLKHGMLGSPPPMRGKEYTIKYTGGDVRITPAHAGKRFLDIDIRTAGEDHPRPCGEKKRSGSVRATPIRITPAHAGKSAAEQARSSANEDHPRPCGEK